MFLRLSQRLFAGGSSPSLKGKCPGTPFGGFPDTHVPLTTQQSVIYTFCIVQWLCHRFTVAHDVFAVGEGLMGNRREAPEPYCYALASVPGSRHA
ncbi:hypothetical protein E7W82_02475 [Cronobacter sakazakii]|nr:hypothetical protein [Cronobacter sakazakii]